MSAGAPAIVLLLAITLPFGGSAHRKTEEGNARYVEGLYEEALRAYTEAQVKAPEAPQLYYDIGNVLYRQGDYEGAAEAFTRACPLDESRDVCHDQCLFIVKRHDPKVGYEGCERVAVNLWTCHGEAGKQG